MSGQFASAHCVRREGRSRRHVPHGRRFLRIAILTVVVGAAVLVAAPASAHLVAKPQCDTLKCRLASQTENLKHARYVCKNGAHRSKRWSCSAVGWLSRELKKTNAKLAVLARPPHYNEWMCIHRYEGSWTDPGSPYWGGLQMDEGFQKAYGYELYRSKGTADHWTPLEQMWVAERAYRTRGFWPWPNTARWCGLI
jgi:hypothetical protein